jgi:hypothetical protein
MKIEQKFWTEADGWVSLVNEALPVNPQLVLVFGGRQLIGEEAKFAEIRKMYPRSSLLLCSTAGEILGAQVRDNSLALSAIYFEKTPLKFAYADIHAFEESYEVGKKLANDLKQEDPVHVMIFADGLRVNGTQLIRGINEVLPANVSVTGGLVGDGYDFKKTLVGFNEAGKENKVAAVGFYGSALRVGYGSLGGWDPFGVERTITKSKNNILYEVDGRPALALYKEYLGEQAKGLPGTGLLFPLRLRTKEGNREVEVIRSFSGVNEEDQSITFFGDMPEGNQVALMKASFDRLIDGAEGAGKMSVEPFHSGHAQLAILISCVGRKLVLKERTEEEVEAVRGEVGEEVAVTGFYSYGEISPVTTFREE